MPKFSSIARRVISLLCLLVLSSSAWAQHDGGNSESSDEFGGNHEKHHILGVFLGDTTQDRLERQGGTFGLEYERRFFRPFGVGLTAEHVFGDFNTNLLIVPLALHMERWKVSVGPGLEFSDDETEELIRVGVEYGFEFGEWEISPQVDLDFVEDERVFVFGLLLARAF